MRFRHISLAIVTAVSVATSAAVVSAPGSTPVSVSPAWAATVAEQSPADLPVHSNAEGPRLVPSSEIEALPSSTGSSVLDFTLPLISYVITAFLALFGLTAGAPKYSEEPTY